MVGSVENHKLVVSLEARMRSYERAVEKAQQQTNARMKGIEGALKRPQREMDRLGDAADKMQGRLSKIGSSIKAFGAGLLGGIAAGGVAGVAASLAAVAKSIATIGDEAKRAGLETDAFQQWKFVAEQNRIGLDQMVDGFKELSLRADEFISTGSGPAAEAFSRLGFRADDLRERLKNPSALMLEIIDRLGQLDKAAQIRISDEIFGGSAGERFVELIDQGRAGIEATIDQARQLGLVMDAEVIKRAAEVDRQFNLIATTVGTSLKGAIVDAALALQGFIDSFRSFENQQASSLDTQLATIGKQRMDLENKILKLRGEQRDAGFNVFGRDYESDIAYLEAERAALGETEAQILRVVEARRKAAEVPPPGTGAPTFTPYELPKSNSGRSGAASETEREAEAVRRLIAELEEELRLVGATNVEKEVANTLRRAGVSATSAEGQRIAELVTQIDAETEAIRRNEEAQKKRTQSLEALFQMGGDALASIADGSLTAEEALRRLIVQLAQAAIQAMLLGTGPLAGLLGGLMGGRTTAASVVAAGRYSGIYHDGGVVGATGRRRLDNPAAYVGAPRFHDGLGSDEFRAILQRGEHVLTAKDASRTANTISGLSGSVRSGGSGRAQIDIGVSVDDDGKIVAIARQVSGQEADIRIRQYDQKMPDRMGAIQRNPRLR